MHRPRLKSRLGCAECKRRRIKCDELRPVCTNCSRHRHACSFSEPHKSETAERQKRLTTELPQYRAQIEKYLPTPLARLETYLERTGRFPADLRVPSSSSAVKDGSSSTDDIPVYLSYSPSSISDLELLHHFTISTCQTITSTAAKRTVYQVALPQLSFSHGFLRHCIFAVSALHLAHLHPERAEYYASLSAFHHGHALSLLAPALPDALASDPNAVFGFSSLISLYSFAQFSHAHCFPAAPVSSAASTASHEASSPSQPSSSESAASPKDQHEGRSKPKSYIAPFSSDWITLTRGVASVVASGWNKIKNGPFRVFLEMDDLPPGTNVLAPEVGERLDALTVLWKDEGAADPDILTAFTLAIQFLKYSFLKLDNLKGEWCDISAVLSWPALMTETYMSLLSQRHPVALIVLAHFVVCLHRLRHYWWLGDSSVQILASLTAELPEEWLVWIQWPMEKVAGKNPEKREQSPRQGIDAAE